MYGTGSYGSLQRHFPIDEILFQTGDGIVENLASLLGSEILGEKDPQN